MSAFIRWLPKLTRRSPLAPRVFTNSNFEQTSASQIIEKETCPDYLAARYNPVRIGQVFASRYQVVGKLGYGAFSTVWLARDLNQQCHAVLKVFVRAQAMGRAADRELNIFRHMGAVAYKFLDILVAMLSGPFQTTSMLQGRMESTSILYICRCGRAYKNSSAGTLSGVSHPSPVLGIVLQRLFLALDFMHTDCHLIHTDIKADNIMFGFDDNSVFEDFERDELEHPCPRKEADGRVIYVSRELKIPQTLGPPVLCDLGAAVAGEKPNVTDVQPGLYRAPEVILQIPWSYEIDIWNTGCMTQDIFESRHMFSGRDLEHNAYRSRAHLASIIALLGPPPQDFVARSSVRDKFFAQDGSILTSVGPLPLTGSLEETETTLQGNDREHFLQLMGKMIQWTLEGRSTAKELLEDRWLKTVLK